MLSRKRFHWNVPVIAVESGTSYDVTVTSYWSPDHETTSDAVAQAGAIEHGRKVGTKCVPGGAPELVTAT